MSGRGSLALPEGPRSEASTSAQEQIESHPEIRDPKFNLLECKAAWQGLCREVANTERFIQRKAYNKGRALHKLWEIRYLCDNKFLDRMQLLEDQSREFPFESDEVHATAKRNPNKFLLTEAQRMKINKEKYDTRKRVLEECTFYVNHVTKIKRKLFNFRKNVDRVRHQYTSEQKQERVGKKLEAICKALSIYYP